MVPEYRVLRREAGLPFVLACMTPVQSPLTIHPLVPEKLPELHTEERLQGVSPLASWTPGPFSHDPPFPPKGGRDLGVAVDIGTTTIRLLILDLAGGEILGEAAAYNPQIGQGADVIARIVSAEKGRLTALSSSVRKKIAEMVTDVSEKIGLCASGIRCYSVAGNPTMVHLLLGKDPSGIRRVPSEPEFLSIDPVDAPALGWPGSANNTPVSLVPAVGGWVGGDITGGMVRAGFSQPSDRGLTLYVDLGTNGEIAIGREDFALACACSAGPAFEGGGIRCGMRADSGAVDGARIDAGTGKIELSVIGNAEPAGICGSGLITLAGELFRAGWIDRSGSFTDALPDIHRVGDDLESALALNAAGTVALWERDISGLVRAKAAVFAGIRSLLGALGDSADPIGKVIVSGNFGRFLNMSAAVGIGLLPDLPTGAFSYIENGSLEGASLALLSGGFLADLENYLQKVTYVDLSDLPGYMDEFVAASFLPHTDPELLKLY